MSRLGKRIAHGKDACRKPVIPLARSVGPRRQQQRWRGGRRCPTASHCRPVREPPYPPTAPATHVLRAKLRRRPCRQPHRAGRKRRWGGADRQALAPPSSASGSPVNDRCSCTEVAPAPGPRAPAAGTVSPCCSAAVCCAPLGIGHRDRCPMALLAPCPPRRPGHQETLSPWRVPRRSHPLSSPRRGCRW